MNNKLTKVLCVDDEQDLRDNINIILSQEGYEVIEASNGEDAYQKFIDNTPDFIVCDIDMPVMNGYNFFKKIHKNHQEELNNIPFIFLTGLHHKDNRIEGIRLGIDDYMLKPIDFDLLLSTIKAKLAKIGERKDLMQQKISAVCDSFVSLIPQEINYPLQDILELSNLLKTDLRKQGDYHNIDKMHNNYATRIYMSALKLRAQIVKLFDKDKVFNIINDLNNYYDLEEVIGDIIDVLDDDQVVFELQDELGEIAINKEDFINNIVKYLEQQKTAKAQNIKVNIFNDGRKNLIISIVSRVSLPVISESLEKMIAAYNGDFKVQVEEDEVYHIISLPHYLLK